MGEGLRSAVELSLAEVGEGVAAVWVVDAVGCGRDESGVERPFEVFAQGAVGHPDVAQFAYAETGGVVGEGLK